MTEKNEDTGSEKIEIIKDDPDWVDEEKKKREETLHAVNAGDKEDVEAVKPHAANEVKKRKKDHSKETRHKRHKNDGSKDLAELLKKKNEMLQELNKSNLENEKLLAIKEDKLLRLAAEFENYKKRTRREWDLHQKNANAELLSDMLGVLDDFDRAFAASEDTGDHFHSGIRMIFSQLMDVLRKAGLSEIEAAGVPFDPQFHEAMGEAESDEDDPGNVLHVVQKGYMLGGQLLRPARVIVVKEKE